MTEYCSECGSKKVDEATGMFEPDTGRPAFRKICPKACSHGFHTSRVPVPGLLFWLFVRCEKCGQRDFR